MRIPFQRQLVPDFGLQLYQKLSNYWQQGLSFILAALIVMGLWQIGVGQSLENWSYNSFFQWRGTLSWDQSIAVIELDADSLQQLQLSPWSRQLYTQLIDQLASAEPAVIVLDTLLAGRLPEDAALANAMNRQGRVILAQAWKSGQPVLTSSVLMQAAIAIGHVQQTPDGDQMVRSLPRDVLGVPTLGIAATQVFTAYTAADQLLPPSQNRVWLNWRSSAQQANRYTLAAVLAGKVPPQYFRNKIVLVGTTAGELSTPFSQVSPPLYLHATLISNLLQQNTLVYLPLHLVMPLLLLFGCIVLGISADWHWFYQLLPWTGLSLVWLGLSWIEFKANVWLPIATPMLWFSLVGGSLLLCKLCLAFQTLRCNEARYTLMMHGFNEGIWDWDLRTDQFYFSPRWKQMIGYEDQSFSDRPQDWFERVHPYDRAALETAISAYVQGNATYFEQDYRLLHRNGSYRWMQSRALGIYGAEGRIKRLIGSQVDITAQRQVEAELWRRTFLDRLTNLPSWTGFTHYLQQAINQTQQDSHHRFAILWLDLDQFKLVNNSLGSPTADRLLLAIAERLQAFLSPHEVIARLGEDEFAILLQPIQDVQQAEAVAKRIQQELTRPFKLDEHEVFVTASIGIAVSAAHYHKPEHILRDAGTAMYRAKAMGRASYLVFDKSMRTGMLVKLRLENDLRRAIAAEERQTQTIDRFNRRVNSIKPVNSDLSVTTERYPELELYYQPIVHLATGKVAGFEALVRWQHAEQGLLFPSRFISMAEETGLIIPLSWWILRTACRQMSQWRTCFPGNTALTMSVNLSSKQFAMTELAEKIQRILQEAELEPTHLKLELTESMVLENVASVVDVLYQLRELGIRLAIDDFGTGYSSLSYLPQFPLTTLKIDRSFVNRLGDCNDNREIVRTILALAHNLRMDVVAEGVETEVQAVRLRDMGCEYGQGYFFSKPLNVEAATQLLANQKTGLLALP